MKKIKKLLFLLLFSILIVPALLSGCSNKPNLKQWSKRTAIYLLSKKNPEYKVQLIKCQTEKVFGSNAAQCTYNLIKLEKIKFRGCGVQFMQSINNNWEIDSIYGGGCPGSVLF